MEDEVGPLEPSLPIRQGGLSQTLKTPAFKGLHVDTHGKKNFSKWHEVKQITESPPSRSHCMACIYNNQYEIPFRIDFIFLVETICRKDPEVMLMSLYSNLKVGH